VLPIGPLLRAMPVAEYLRYISRWHPRQAELPVSPGTVCASAADAISIH
jgi:hypothetical protein